MSNKPLVVHHSLIKKQHNMFIHKLSKYGLLLLAALVISSTLMASSRP